MSADLDSPICATLIAHSISAAIFTYTFFAYIAIHEFVARFVVFVATKFTLPITRVASASFLLSFFL